MTTIDISYASAREFWDEIVLASAGRFETQPTRAHAMAVAIYVSHFLDWAFHEKFLGQDTQDNPAYAAFKEKHQRACPELTWLADLTDIAKHRGLGLKGVSLQQVADSPGSLELELVDGTRHRFGDVTARAIAYWRENL